MKEGLKFAVGKTIAAIVVARSEKSSPRRQVFLVFGDNTHLELYGEAFTCTSGLDQLRDLEAYVKNGGGQVTQVYDEVERPRGAPLTTGPETGPYVVGLPPKPPRFDRRAVMAWQAAARVIAKAKN